MKLGVIAIATFALAPPGYTAEIKAIPPPINQIHITGEIVSGDLDRLASAMKETSPTRPIAVILTSPGGNVETAVQMADFLDGLSQINSAVRIDTVAAKLCASACIIIFAAGKRKMVFQGTQMLVHSVALTGGPGIQQADENGETDETKVVTVNGARWLAAHGMPPSAVGKFVVTSSRSNLAKLDANDLAAWGVETIHY